jgi:predicted RNase H-like HicB family nuclease
MTNDFRFAITLSWSERSGTFLATVPELPGCMADGPTYRDALANAEVVIREWVETAVELGREIPVPGHSLAAA